MFWRREGVHQHLLKEFQVAPTDTAGRGSRKEKIMSLKSLAQKVKNWQRNRESVRELSRMSDRELADLGISRAEIAIVVKGGQRA